MAFVLVLSYSRYPFLRFYLNASLPSLIRGHVAGVLRAGGHGEGPCSMTT